jgi:4'-phosphopantetheinyl transferase
MLSADERARADAMQDAEHRNRFIAAHGALRSILHRVLGIDLAGVPFQAGERGKPSLGSGAAIRFNLAHSRGLGLLALALEREVGVDLEWINETVDLDPLIRRFFSAAERNALSALPEARRREAFFHIWAQKEAYLKGRGEGLAFGLEHFDVLADPDQEAALLADRNDPEARRRWSLVTLTPDPCYRAALAVEGEVTRIEYFSWE